MIKSWKLLASDLKLAPDFYPNDKFPTIIFPTACYWNQERSSLLSLLALENSELKDQVRIGTLEDS